MRQRRQGGIDDVRARLDGLDHHHIGDAGGEVGVNLDRDLDRFLQRLDQIVGVVRHQQARHILQADGVSAGLLD